MAQVTPQTLAQMADPGFLVDVILRVGGRLHMTFEQLDWPDAVERATSALEDGISVEIEEADAHNADEPFADEFDRQE